MLDSVFGLAERYGVNAVLCAGDLFDDEMPGPDWWRPLVDKLRFLDWKNRPLFLLPGNHDPLVSGSIWHLDSFRKLLPPWVHVIDRGSYEFELNPEVILYAVPCQSKAGQNDPCHEIPKRADSDARIRIGLVHGSTFDMQNCQVNFPIGKESAIECGLDYLAIGDTHGFRYVPPDRKIPPTIYPGTPEPTAFDEKDAGNVALVFINRHRQARVTKERVAAWAWEQVEIQNLAQLARLRDRTDLGKRVLRLQVRMHLPPAEFDEAQHILRELRGTEAMAGRVGVLSLDESGLILDTARMDDAVAFLPDVLRETWAMLREQEAAQPEVARKALYQLYQLARKAS